MGEDTLIILNDYTLPLEPEDQFVNSVKNIIKSSGFDVELTASKEDVCLFILQFAVRLRKQRFGFSRSGGRIDVSFKSCIVDDRIFTFIARSCGGLELQLTFTGDCHLKAKESPTSLERVANILAGCGAIQATIFCDAESTAQIQHDFGLKLLIGDSRIITGSSEELSSETTVTDSVGNSSFQYIPFIYVMKREDELQISDVPLLIPILQLPHFTRVYFESGHWLNFGHRDFTLKVFDEICRRPTSLGPCVLENRHLTGYSYLMYILNHFNEAKVENLHVPINKECTRDYLDKVLEVLAQSVYIRTLEISVRDPLYHNFCVDFMLGLRKIAARMMPIDLVFDHLEVDPQHRASVLCREIQGVFRRGKDPRYVIILIMSSVHTLGLARIGQACLLKMLPIELIRWLCSFLVSISDD